MTDGTAFKLVMGFIMVVVCFIVWIPLNEWVGQIGDAMNELTTDADTIARNDIAVTLFSSMMLFIFIVFGLWVLKSSLGRGGEAYG